MSRDGCYIVSKADSDKIDKAFDDMAVEISELQRAKEELLEALLALVTQSRIDDVVEVHERTEPEQINHGEVWKKVHAAIEAHK